jgi:hypothetical protein
MAAVSLMRVVVATVAVACALGAGAVAQLSPTFYDGSCPNLQSIVRSGMVSAVQREPRMGASILRLFFHDCFVNVRSLPSKINQFSARYLSRCTCSWVLLLCINARPSTTG